jgi:dipeptidase E
MMTQGSLYLAGGGTPLQERPVLTAFLERIALPEILYIPLALDPDSDSFKNAEAWIDETLGFLHPDKTLKITTAKQGVTIPDIAFGGIFIGGGNTYRLISALKATGLDTIISRHMQAGCALYGGSAGAIVCGQRLNLAGSPPPTSGDFTGMNLLGGLSCCCHYSDADIQRVKTYVAAYHSGVICLRENAGILFESGRLTSCGTAPVDIYTKENCQILETVI